MHAHATPRITLLTMLTIGLIYTSVLSAREAYFSDDFSTGMENPNLEGWEPFRIDDGQLRLAFDSGRRDDSRRYLRTVCSDYHERQFTFEVTVRVHDRPEGGVTFVGIGHGDRSSEVAYNEPAYSVNFRIHSPNLAGGAVHVYASGFARWESIGSISTEGPHRVRIEKIGDRVTFALDEDYDGTFEADLVQVVEDLPTAAPYMNDRSAHLFVGAGKIEDTFDDLVIRRPEGLPENDCNDNGVDDAIDIADGTSSDENEDTIPDECQGEDCNENGTTDSIDIAQGDSHDRDDDGVPDECQSAHWDVRRDYLPDRFPDDWRYETASSDVSDFTEMVQLPEGYVLADGSSPEHAWVAPEGLGSGGRYGTAMTVTVERASVHLPDDAVFVHPERGIDPAVTWVAPRAGRVRVRGHCGLLRCGVTSNGVEWRLQTNGAPITSVVIPAPGSLPFDEELDVVAGQHVRMRVHARGSSTCDHGFVAAGVHYTLFDCNRNGVEDAMDIEEGDSTDAEDDGIPDECQGEDCNRNGLDDAYDIEQGTSADEDGDGIPDECADIPPEHDCNGNGVEDADEIAAGDVEDVDGDGVPDECRFRVAFVESGLYRVTLRVTSETGFRGGEIGLAYDSSAVRATCALPGPDFPGDAADIFCDLEPGVLCDLPSGTDRGLTVAWIHDGVGTEIPAGTYDLLDIAFEPLTANSNPACTALRFTSCIGPEGAPVESVLTIGSNDTVVMATIDGEVCGVDQPFRRGDVNFDGRFNVTDSIVALGCLFLGTPCGDCLDASDCDDDGRFNVTDPVYFLNWRFLGGPPPSAPFVECGIDETADALVGCASTACP